MMRLKRLGRGTAWNSLQHRRFHFEEVALTEKLADMPNHPRADHKGVTSVFVDDQVNIALTITLLGIRQAMVLVGQRAQRLGQQLDRRHMHIQITLAGARQVTFCGDDVAQIPMFDFFQRLSWQAFTVNVDLQAATHILQHHKGTPIEHDTASNFDRNGRLS